MGMNDTPSADRVHIGFFGKRNAGKSSVLNAVTGQDLAVVSDVCGTTTDPVVKAMELLPLGPVVVIDTPGIDDEGELGALRVKKSYQTLNKPTWRCWWWTRRPGRGLRIWSCSVASARNRFRWLWRTTRRIR